MKLTRREALKGLGVFTLGQLMPFHWARTALAAKSGAEAIAPYNISDLDILSQGRDGDLFLPQSQVKDLSVATRLTVKSGVYHVEPTPIVAAHDVLFVPQTGRYVVLSRHGVRSAILSPDMKFETTFEAIPGYEFAGHGVLLPDDVHMALSFRRRHDDPKLQTGAIGIYDVKTGVLAFEHDMGGSYPHDIKLNTAKTHLIFSNRSSYAYDTDATAKPTGKISAMRLSDYTLDYDIATPAGDPRHIVVTDEDKVYAVSTTKIPQSDVVKNGWPLHDLEVKDGWASDKPFPIVEYDLKTKKTRSIVADLVKQRRSQSVAFNKQTGKTGAVFVFSNTLVTIDKAGNEAVHDTRRYLIDAPIGLQSIDGTSLVAIGDVYQGLSLVDMESMELVRYYPVKMYRSSHITVAPSKFS